MPMYEYQCVSCGERTEAMRKYDKRADPGPRCACGGPTHYVVSGGRPQTYRLKNLGGHPSKHNIKEI